MSLQSKRRFLEKVYELSEADPETWVEIDAVVARLPEGDRIDIRTRDDVAGLWEADLLYLSADEAHVAVTPKALRQLRNGEQPA